MFATSFFPVRSSMSYLLPQDVLNRGVFRARTYYSVVTLPQKGVIVKFSILRECLKLCSLTGVPATIWGHKGIGKSQSVAHIALVGGDDYLDPENKKDLLPMGFIDFRCSQVEASDIRGLPDKQDGRTHFLPPVDMPIGDMTAFEIDKELKEIGDPVLKAKRHPWLIHLG